MALWAVALVCLFCLARFQTPPPGWDAKSYANFMSVVKDGRDPYQESVADQNAYRARLLGSAAPPARVSCVNPPCPWIYSPLSLPSLELAARLPPRFVEVGFAGLILLGAVAAPVLLLAAAQPGVERTLFSLLAPAALFFPGLLLDLVIFSGNIAYILYGIVFAGAVFGWKRHRWLPFYLAVLLASFFKPPLLTLLAIPLLSEEGAWRGALITAGVGLGCFAAQPLLWPKDFPLYLHIVDMLFRYDADFGFSPAGLLASLLHHEHRSYSPWTTVAYLAYSPILVVVLWTLRRRYFRGAFSLEAWIPVLLLGTMLLNPRNKEYDLAAFTVPVALITWRLFGGVKTPVRAALGSTVLLVVLDLLSKRIGLPFTHGLLTPALWGAGAFHLPSASLPTHPGAPRETAATP